MWNANNRLDRDFSRSRQATKRREPFDHALNASSLSNTPENMALDASFLSVHQLGLGGRSEGFIAPVATARRPSAAPAAPPCPYAGDSASK
jgi:hypothetical protein